MHRDYSSHPFAKSVLKVGSKDDKLFLSEPLIDFHIINHKRPEEILVVANTILKK